MKEKYIPSYINELNNLKNRSNYYLNGGYKNLNRKIWYKVKFYIDDFNIQEKYYNKKDLEKEIKNIKKNKLYEKGIGIISNEDKISSEQKFYNKFNELDSIMDKYAKSKRQNIDKIHFHFSKMPIYKLDSRKNIMTSNREIKNTFNPEGFWFSCGKSWFNFLNNSFPTFIEKTFVDFIYRVKINKNSKKNIKYIKNKNSFTRFVNKYFNKNANNLGEVIDWKKFKNDFDGLIICPFDIKYFNKHVNKYLYYNYYVDDVLELINNVLKKDALKKKYDLRKEWQRLWDIHSGVIWEPENVIEEIELIAYWDQNKEKWVKPGKNFDFKNIKIMKERL